VIRSDPGYPQYPASICTDLSTVTVTPNGPTPSLTLSSIPADYPNPLPAEPECTVQDSTTGGTLVGTSGSVTLTSTQGTSYSTTSTVTRVFSTEFVSWNQLTTCAESAALAVGDTFGVKMTVPGVEVSDSITVTATFTNTLSTACALIFSHSRVLLMGRHSTQNTVNLQQSQGITMVAPVGSTCNLSVRCSSSHQFISDGSNIALSSRRRVAPRRALVVCVRPPQAGRGSSSTRGCVLSSPISLDFPLSSFRRKQTDGHYLCKSGFSFGCNPSELKRSTGALNMDYFLTLDQRSSFINFKAAVESSTLSTYQGHCT
jgi:hypothetical protein